MKITHMLTDKGSEAKEHVMIKTKEGIFLMCFYKIIAFKDKKDNVILDKKYWNLSRTTSKYRNLFLGENSRGVQKNINRKIYTFENLNK